MLESPDDPVSRRLSRACLQARETAGKTMLDIAVRAGVAPSVIHAFEDPRKRGWRRRTDEIVAAYEHECGLAPDELWRRAVNG